MVYKLPSYDKQGSDDVGTECYGSLKINLQMVQEMWNTNPTTFEQSGLSGVQ